eukprot:57510-Hanusia_phi.AAC.1
MLITTLNNSANRAARIPADSQCVNLPRHSPPGNPTGQWCCSQRNSFSSSVELSLSLELILIILENHPVSLLRSPSPHLTSPLLSPPLIVSRAQFPEDRY